MTLMNGSNYTYLWHSHLSLSLIQIQVALLAWPLMYSVWDLGDISLSFSLSGCVSYCVLAHFKHWLSGRRAFTLTKPAEFRALKVPGLRPANSQKMQCETMDTSRPKRAPSWLRSGRGGALSAAFQFGKLADWRLANHFNHYCWLQ